MTEPTVASPVEDAAWEDVPAVVEPIYGIEERPARFWEAILYGWQHTLVDISPFVLPLALAAALAMPAAESAQLINSCLFAMGIATLIQTTIGNRLPIIQGPSATVAGTLAPVAAQYGAAALWGAAFIGGLAEMTLGASRVLGALRRFFPPIVSGVVVTAIALSLAQFAVRLTIGDGRPLNFVFAGTVMLLIVLLQVGLPRLAGGLLARGAIFLSIWAVGLGLGGALGEVDWALVAAKPWFGLPRLFPYGGPGFGWELSGAAIAAVAVGYLGSIVESLGDYAATCAVAGERYRVQHMNRGIFAEGLGCVVASVLGAMPVTSYTQNIGVIAATRVASRFVVRLAAVILLLYGLCPKFGALLVALPRPVLGGVFLVVCGLIAVSGLRLLAASRPTTAGSFVIGISLVTAVSLPSYIQNNLGAKYLATVPPFLAIVLTNTVVLAMVLAIGLNLVLNVWLRGDRARLRV